MLDLAHRRLHLRGERMYKGWPPLLLIVVFERANADLLSLLLFLVHMTDVAEKPLPKVHG